MIATLPMYDRPETAGANDRLWTLIREELGYGPDRLKRPAGFMADWTSHDLLLSQTCGLPYRLHLKDRVALVGTPNYGLPGATPGHYRSMVVVRAEDDRRRFARFRGAVLAVNSPGSQSGWAAIEHEANLLGFSFLENRLVSGGHAASVAAVAQGLADIAAIDEVTWALLQRYQPATTAQLRVLERTPETPGLPLITAAGRDADAIFRAVERAAERLDDQDRATLLLDGIVKIPAEAYLAVPTPDGSE